MGTPPVLAGVLLSMAALALALYGIHRLATLELARAARSSLAGSRAADAARLAVMLTAFAPMAFFFSAVYSESLYLALSVGLFWSARHGRWMWVGVLGALAGATRSAGLVLALPALMIYLYGPREDRPARLARASARSRLRPRYRLRRDACGWVCCRSAWSSTRYLALAGGIRWRRSMRRKSGAGTSPARTWASGTASRRRSRAPVSCSPSSAITCSSRPVMAVRSSSAGHNLMLLAFLLAAIPAIVGRVRRLPLAYGAYVIAALAMPLSYPVSSQPLMSLPRFLVVLFPLGIWLAAWLAEHPRAQRPRSCCRPR